MILIITFSMCRKDCKDQTSFFIYEFQQIGKHTNARTLARGGKNPEEILSILLV